MKTLIWKLVLPLTFISFFFFTKWWYVYPVDAPETLMYGFPYPYICRGWHTSLSNQIFISEFIIDLSIYFIFWMVLVYLIDRFLIRLSISKIPTIILMILMGISILISTIIASNDNNIFYFKRPWEMEVKKTGYQFIWEFQDVSSLQDSEQ